MRFLSLCVAAAAACVVSSWSAPAAAGGLCLVKEASCDCASHDHWPGYNPASRRHALPYITRPRHAPTAPSYSGKGFEAAPEVFIEHLPRRVERRMTIIECEKVDAETGQCVEVAKAVRARVEGGDSGSGGGGSGGGGSGSGGGGGNAGGGGGNGNAGGGSGW